MRLVGVFAGVCDFAGQQQFTDRGLGGIFEVARRSLIPILSFAA
jgi:hypothetical protein